MSRSSRSHWITVRPGIEAGSMGTTVDRGSRVSTKPPTWMERCRGSWCNPSTMSASARTRGSAGSRPARWRMSVGTLGGSFAPFFSAASDGGADVCVSTITGVVEASTRERSAGVTRRVRASGIAARRSSRSKRLRSSGRPPVPSPPMPA